MHSKDPGLDANFAAGHNKQDLCDSDPVLLKNVPASHELQEGEPGSAAYVPEAQIVQLMAPASEYVPLGQATQAEAPAWE